MRPEDAPEAITLDLDFAPETHDLPKLDHPLEERQATAPFLQLSAELALHRLEHRDRQRPHRAGVQVRDSLERREQRTGFLERHLISTSTGAWSESRRPSTRLRSTGQTAGDPARAPRTRT